MKPSRGDSLLCQTRGAHHPCEGSATPPVARQLEQRLSLS